MIARTESLIDLKWGFDRIHGGFIFKSSSIGFQCFSFFIEVVNTKIVFFLKNIKTVITTMLIEHGAKSSALTTPASQTAAKAKPHMCAYFFFVFQRFHEVIVIGNFTVHCNWEASIIGNCCKAIIDRSVARQPSCLPCGFLNTIFNESIQS